MLYTMTIELTFENFYKESALFRDLPNVVFVEIGIDFIELRLMALCDHHIIANSTFSWWGAFLHNPPRWRRRRRRSAPRRAQTPREGGEGAMDAAQDGSQMMRESARESERRREREMGREGGSEQDVGVVICPATWGRGDDPAAGRQLGEGDVYPEEWVRLPNHFVES